MKKNLKRMTAVLVSLVLFLSGSLQAMADNNYASRLFDHVVMSLPDNMYVVSEDLTNDDFPIIMQFGVNGRENEVQIIAQILYVEQYENYTTDTLPASEIQAWDDYYLARYTNAYAGMLTSDDPDDDYAFLIPYMATGQSGENGNWFLNYISVLAGMYIMVTGQTGPDGFDDETFDAVIDAYDATVRYVMNAALGDE